MTLAHAEPMAAGFALLVDVAWALRLLVAPVLLVAAGMKIVSFDRSRTDLVNLGVPAQFSIPAVIVVVVVESLVAVAVAIAPAKAAGLSLAGLFLAFIVILIRSRRLGVPCGCLGESSVKSPAGVAFSIRMLGLLAGMVIALGDDVVGHWPSRRAQLLALVGLLAVGLIAARKSGRLTYRLPESRNSEDRMPQGVGRRDFVKQLGYAGASTIMFIPGLHLLQHAVAGRSIGTCLMDVPVLGPLICALIPDCEVPTVPWPIRIAMSAVDSKKPTV